MFAQNILFGFGRGDKTFQASDTNETFAGELRVTVRVIDCEACTRRGGLFASIGDKIQVQFNLRLVLARKIINARIIFFVRDEILKKNIHQRGQVCFFRIKFNIGKAVIFQNFIFQIRICVESVYIKPIIKISFRLKRKFIIKKFERN